MDNFLLLNILLNYAYPARNRPKVLYHTIAILYIYKIALYTRNPIVARALGLAAAFRPSARASNKKESCIQKIPHRAVIADRALAFKGGEVQP